MSSFLWTSDYVDLRTYILTQEQIDFLEEKSPQFQKIVDIGCPTCSGTKEYIFTGKKQDCICRQQLQLYKHYEKSNIGLTYQRLTWLDYRGDQTAYKVSHQYLTNHQSMVKSGVGLMFHGEEGVSNFGTGKTLLVSLMAKELVKLGYSVYFCTFGEMIEEFTKGWSSDKDKKHFEASIVNADVFVLDDVGKEFKTKNNLSESTFDYVLRQRVQDSRPTLLTTNLSPKKLAEGYGSAIFSLLTERSVSHGMLGEDYRPKARERTLKEVMSQEVRPIS